VRTADVASAVPAPLIALTLAIYLVLYLALVLAYVAVLGYMAQKPGKLLEADIQAPPAVLGATGA
jgi:cytochrome d ubiquinol oxidase subunit I